MNTTTTNPQQPPQENLQATLHSSGGNSLETLDLPKTVELHIPEREQLKNSTPQGVPEDIEQYLRKQRL